MENRVLVTGGCGFVGSNLVKRLVENGHNVRVLDSLARGRRSYLDGLSSVELVVGDIRDIASCEAAFENVDKVVHLAAFGSVVESVEDPLTNFEMNVVGTFNVLNLCVQHGIEKLVFSSTGGALIGNATPPVSEQSLPKPISPYGAGKLCCEAYCHAFARSYDLKTVCLRFANVYGPNSYHKTGVINKFFHAVRSGEPLIVYGDGSSTRDYIHVSDLVRGIELALTSDSVSDDVIHLAAGREVSLLELAEAVKSAANKPEIELEFRASRKGEVERNFASYDYAKQVLGFEPTIKLEDGLKSLWDSYDWSQ